MINSIYFVILWNGVDSNLRRSECKVLVILEIPRNGNHIGKEPRRSRTSVSIRLVYSWCCTHYHMCDLSSVSIVYPCYWIGWCVHVIHITHPNPQVRIHTYTRCLSHIRVATHMCPGAVWQREKYIYLKTVSQLSKFVQSEMHHFWSELKLG